MRVDIVENTRVFARLEGEWNAVLAQSRSDAFFLRWEWLFPWWQHLSGARRLQILTVRSGGELRGIAPFVLRPGSIGAVPPLPVVEFLGSGTAGSDYLDLIVECGWESEILEALGGELAESSRMMSLMRLRHDGALSAGLADTLQRRGWVTSAVRGEFCPYIPLEGHTWDTYLAGLGSRHRESLRRKLRKLSSKFDMRFASVTDEGERPAALATMMRLHDLRWNQGRRSEAFSTTSLRAFHDDVSRLALKRGWLRLYTLYLNDQPAASLYGFRYGRVFYFFQSGFEPRFRDLSVGLVMMGLSIRRALEEGAEEFDLLHGTEAYKFHWTEQMRPLMRLESFPPGMRGGLYRSAVDLTRRARRLARHVVTAGNRLLESLR